MAHVFTQPKPYAGFYADEPDKTIVAHLPLALTEEEEKSEFAKYYHMGAVEPPADLMESMKPGNELPAEAAFMPEEYTENVIGRPENFDLSGFRIMDNGAAFIAFHTYQDGVNDENTAYFNEHFANGTGDLFYKLWCPNAHARLYPDVGLEDMGWGLSKVAVTQFLPKEAFGISADPAETDPYFVDFIALNMEVRPADAADDTEPLRLFETSYTRQTEKGREVIHRFWIGLHWIGGKSALYPVADRDKAVFYTINTVHHSVSETATINRNIVEFYKNTHCQ